MKKSLKTFKKVATHNGATILIYGERWEDEFIDGIKLFRAKYSRDGRSVVDLDIFGNDTDILLTRPYTRTRYFNMGWAICSEDDSFNIETGIEICKKRFRKSPLKSESGLFLTNDMVEALLLNEVNYIIGHWDKFYKKTKKKNVEDTAETEEEIYDVILDPVAEPENEENLGIENEEVQKEDQKENNDELLPGDYVAIDGKDRKAIGVISEVSDKVYFEWICQFKDGDTQISNSYGTKTLYASKNSSVRHATKEEISEVTEKLLSAFDIKWDPDIKSFVTECEGVVKEV